MLAEVLALAGAAASASSRSTAYEPPRRRLRAAIASATSARLGPRRVTGLPLMRRPIWSTLTPTVSSSGGELRGLPSRVDVRRGSSVSRSINVSFHTASSPAGHTAATSASTSCVGSCCRVCVPGSGIVPASIRAAMARATTFAASSLLT